ncbi:unnamed protein product [Oppiella nova]|uniref:Cyanate lyase C-terminal domain-containing protein n=1 Tax=Oppiella nova TaxID=334625 RepID=A0A7R9QQF1_9ACAR|nr:unnamed protein product [Oppiella nova]CAG2170035.1 unnamed protein product [Oppiella nova]
MASPTVPVVNDYPVYHDDYHRRYNNNAFGFEPKKSTQNLSPIIVFRNESNAKFAKQSTPSLLSCCNADAKNHFLTVRNLLKVVFIMFCVGMCFYQTVDIFKKYSSFPMDVNVVVEEMKLLQLPAITVCNNNIVKRELLFEKFPNLRKETNNSMKKLEKFTREWIAKTPLNEVLELAPTLRDFVDVMECDTQYDPDGDDPVAKKLKCVDIDVITSLQKNGICFTYFHKMAKHVRPKPKACVQWGTCPQKEPFFDTNEIIRFELDFQPKQYTNQELPISGRIAIHDNTEIGNSLSNSYNLQPGFYYQFYIKRQSTQMLRKPFATNCFDYVAEEGQRLNRTQDFASIPLSRKQCASGCTSRFAINQCFCWPPELPYVRNNGLDVNRSLTWCQWRFVEAQNLYGMCWDKKARLKCAMQCQPSCWTDHYELSVQKLQFEYYGRPDWDSEDEKLMNTSAVVSIRYWTTEHTIHKYSPMFAILDMVCYVGGLVSMYTGISLIAIYDFFILSLFIIKKKGLKTKSDAKVALLAAKRRQNLTFAEMADKLAANKVTKGMRGTPNQRLSSQVRLSAAIFGEQPFDKDTAARVLQFLDLSDDRLLELMQEKPEIRGQNEHFFSDPFIARLLEVIRVYGPTLKAIVEEENGNGIVSAVDCRLACDKYDDADGTRRVRITIDGKFLEYK